MPRKSQSPDGARARRTRSDIRESLLESALVEVDRGGSPAAEKASKLRARLAERIGSAGVSVDGDALLILATRS
jgi:hypothetical protein